MPCTMCRKQEGIVPWGTETLCLDCADPQIDLMAQAVAMSGEVDMEYWPLDDQVEVLVAV